MYDMTEELIASDRAGLAARAVTEQTRVQINVRRVHAAVARDTRALCRGISRTTSRSSCGAACCCRSSPSVAADGTLRVRQFTRKAETGNPATLTAGRRRVRARAAICFSSAKAGSFAAARAAASASRPTAAEQRWLDYRVVIGDGLFWYRKRRLDVRRRRLAEEIAGFPHVDLDEARLFSCGISWARRRTRRRRKPIDSVDLHDRGGRARFRTPDGRALQLELHGRDWPLSEGRESLVLILTDGKADSEPIASSWTSLSAARVGIDIGWLAIDCAPVVSETGEQQVLAAEREQPVEQDEQHPYSEDGERREHDDDGDGHEQQPALGCGARSDAASPPSRRAARDCASAP